jgi:hypothetical protein
VWRVRSVRPVRLVRPVRSVRFRNLGDEASQVFFRGPLTTKCPWNDNKKQTCEASQSPNILCSAAAVHRIWGHARPHVGFVCCHLVAISWPTGHIKTCEALQPRPRNLTGLKFHTSKPIMPPRSNQVNQTQTVTKNAVESQITTTSDNRTPRAKSSQGPPAAQPQAMKSRISIGSHIEMMDFNSWGWVAGRLWEPFVQGDS